MILYDSIDPRLIPSGAAAVAGYGDGRWCWAPSWYDGTNGWDRHPDALQLVIVISAAHGGDVLDVEKGDASPADCPAWADRFRRAGRRRPTIYHDRASRAAVLAAMAGRPYDWWCATLDGTRAVDGAVAVQYVDRGGWDESLVLDPAWLGVEPPAAVPVLVPRPHLWDATEDAMIIFEYLGQLHAAYVDAHGRLLHHFYAAGEWAVDVPMSGLVGDGPVGYDAGFNGQLHLFALRPEGALGHAWYSQAEGWKSDVLAAPALPSTVSG